MIKLSFSLGQFTGCVKAQFLCVVEISEVEAVVSMAKGHLKYVLNIYYHA